MISNLNSILEKNVNIYKEITPFSHIRLKNLFSTELLDDLLNNILEIKDKYKWWRLCTKGSDFSDFGKSAEVLTNYLISNEWVNFLSNLTGIKNLRADKSWHGSGINFEKRGCHLEPHTDFTHSKNIGYRRVNVLLFLSKNWKKDWGGYNELGRFENNMYERIKSYKPEFNTMVIFNTSSISFHGFDLVKCPEDKARIVVSCYYYTDDKGPHKKKSESTNYVGWDKERKQKKEYLHRDGTGWRKLK